MVVAGRVLEDGDVAIMMVEAEATEKTIQLVKGGAEAPTEEVVASGLDAAKPFIKVLCKAQSDLAAKAAKPTAEFPIFLDYEDDVLEALTAAVKSKLAQALTIAGKQDREAEQDRVKDIAAEKLLPQFEGREKEISAAYRALTKKLVRERVIKDKVRIDGRSTRTSVRSPPRSRPSRACTARRCSSVARPRSWASPPSTCSAWSSSLDTLSPVTRKRYMHDYNFPPYSSVRRAAWAPRSAARSATAPSPSARSCRSCRPARKYPTRSVRCPRPSAPTARPPWARSAPPPCRC